MDRIACALALFTLFAAAPLRAQSPPPGPAEAGGSVDSTAIRREVPRYLREYDWGRRLLLSEVPVPRFRTTRISIRGLNPVCYSYRRELKTQQVVVPSTAALGNLLGISSGAKPKPESGAPFAEGGRKATRGVLPAAALAVRERLLAAQEAIAQARTSVRAAGLHVSQARQDADSIARSACSPSVPFRNTFNAWTAAYARHSDGLATAERELESARTGLAEARRHLREASLGEDRLLQLREYAAVRDTTGTAARALADELEETGRDLELADEERTTTHEALLQTVGSLERANAGMISADSLSVMHVDVRPGLLDAAYEVKVTETAHPRKPGEPTKPEEAAFVVPVDRTLRILMSAGFAFSPVRAPIHGRSNRPVPDSAGKTYSTYDVIDREELAYAPLIQANALLGRAGPLPLGVSFGAAVREVRTKKGIDFLAGFTASLQDQLFVTFGVYNARREYLRLGDAEEVRQKAVPGSVSDADAIGVERKSSFGFSFSFKN